MRGQLTGLDEDLHDDIFDRWLMVDENVQWVM